MKRQTLLSQIMSEHIGMPGFPQIIVTRGYAYKYLKSLGWNESECGFGSLDYTVFSQTSTEAPLSEDMDYWLQKPEVISGLSRDRV